MQPKPSLIETQKALATAVRLANAQPQMVMLRIALLFMLV